MRELPGHTPRNNNLRSYDYNNNNDNTTEKRKQEGTLHEIGSHNATPN